MGLLAISTRVLCRFWGTTGIVGRHLSLVAPKPVPFIFQKAHEMASMGPLALGPFAAGLAQWPRTSKTVSIKSKVPLWLVGAPATSRIKIQPAI